MPQSFHGLKGKFEGIPINLMGQIQCSVKIGLRSVLMENTQSFHWFKDDFQGKTHGKTGEDFPFDQSNDPNRLDCLHLHRMSWPWRRHRTPKAMVHLAWLFCVP
jgi:hypothetical protein